MAEYWLQKHDEAMLKARAALSQDSEAAYLELADHYWTLHRRLDRGNAPHRRSAAPTFDQC
jgi:hypothetical protein